MAFSRRSNEQIVGKFWILVMFELGFLLYVFFLIYFWEKAARCEDEGHKVPMKKMGGSVPGLVLCVC